MTKTNAKTAAATKLARKTKAENPDAIVQSSGMKGGDMHFVKSAGGDTLTFPTGAWTGAIREASEIGQSFAALKALVDALPKPTKGKAELARGVESRKAPHSAKALSDANGAARGANKADKAALVAKAKATKAAARKAERTAKASPKADDTRKITVLDKKFTYGREGTARRAAWDACAKAKTVADYAAAGGALKYLPRWTAAGAIKLG